MLTRKTLLTAWLMALPLPALAHVAPGARGPNGGQMQDLGPYHAELLARDGELTLFLFDTNDRPLGAGGVTGSAIVLAEGRQQTLPFTPRPDGTALVATGDFRASRGLRVVAQIIPGPGAARAQARFTPAD